MSDAGRIELSHWAAAAGLVCPRCGSAEKHAVVDSRAELKTVRRRRYCAGCATRFTTYEMTAFDFRKAQQWVKHLDIFRALANRMLLDAEGVDGVIVEGAREEVLLRDVTASEKDDPLPLRSRKRSPLP